MVFVLASLSLGFVLSASAEVTIEEKQKLLGKEIRVEQRLEKAAIPGGAQSSTDVSLLGKERSLLKLQSAPEVSAENELRQKNDLYVAGLRVWGGGGKIENKGYAYEGLIPPTQLAWPILTYPVGPLLLRLDAGVNYQASLKARAIPSLTRPIQKLSLNTSLEAKAAAAGYVEGYAQFTLVRGGVGGTIEMIDGFTKVSVDTEIRPDMENIPEPTVDFQGKLMLLKGRVYGFIDTYRLLASKWKRSLNKNFFVFGGKCWAYGEEKCETP